MLAGRRKEFPLRVKVSAGSVFLRLQLQDAPAVRPSGLRICNHVTVKAAISWITWLTSFSGPTSCEVPVSRMACVAGLEIAVEPTFMPVNATVHQ